MCHLFDITLFVNQRHFRKDQMILFVQICQKTILMGCTFFFHMTVSNNLSYSSYAFLPLSSLCEYV